jgi:hypothetical protein
VTDLSDCKTAKDVANILAPEVNGLIGFEGSSVFIPAPVLRKAILASRTNKPFKLIPIIMKAARTFNSEHEEDEITTSLALTHPDDLNAWLYGAKVGLIKKPDTRLTPTTWKSQLSAKNIMYNASKGCQEPHSPSTTAQ